jgi:RNA polymerase sigma-70 factor, ECF subfamily
VEGTGESDALLVERICAGDAQALAAIYDQHAGLVYGLARRVTREEQFARDVTQEVFTYLWEMPGRVDLSRGSLRSFLAMLAHRRAVDLVRRIEARTRAETASAMPEIEDGPETTVVDEVTQAWRKQHLADLLDTLPVEQREALRLAYFDGLTYVQVAKTLGIPEGTAKTRLRTALGKLRTMLTAEAKEATP